MNSKDDHAQITINPFLIYIFVALGAVLLQRFLPLPFIEQSAARIIGVMIMIINIIIGLPAARKMLSAKTSLNPHRSTTALVFSGPYCFSIPMYIGLTLLYAGLRSSSRLPGDYCYCPLSLRSRSGSLFQKKNIWKQNLVMKI